MNNYLSPFGMEMILVVCISGWGWLVYKALQKQSRTLNEQEMSLKKKIACLEQAERDYQKKQKEQEEKKADLARHDQIRLQQLENARIRQEIADNQIALFKKQINKLQSDLHHARQRAKRLLGVKRLAEKDCDVVE